MNRASTAGLTPPRHPAHETREREGAETSRGESEMENSYREAGNPLTGQFQTIRVCHCGHFNVADENCPHCQEDERRKLARELELQATQEAN